MELLYGLSPRRAGNFNHVVGFEAVDDAAISVGEFFFELGDIEVGSKVGALATILRPNFVAGVDELVDEFFGIHAIKGFALQADVVEAYIDRVDAETGAVFLVVGVLVEVVVQSVVVNHLGNREVFEAVGVVGAPQVLREYLHEHSFACAAVAGEE